MKKTKIALIGYGYWGKILHKYLVDSDLFDLTNIYFPSLSKYSEKEIYNHFGERFTKKIDQVWTNNLIKNVVIATPIKTHYEIAEVALLNNKNILVEKPLAEGKEEAQKLAELAKKTKLVLETEYTYSYSKALKYAKKIIDENVIGCVESITICLKQLGRFLLYDVYSLLGSHALSMLDIFIPLAEIELSSQPLIVTEGKVTGALINYYSILNKINGYIEIQLHSQKRYKNLTIYGERGTIIYEPDSDNVLSVTLYERAKDKKQKDIYKKAFKFDEKNNLTNAINNFYCVVNGIEKSNIDRSVTISSILESFRE